jgi:hypothetical protein
MYLLKMNSHCQISFDNKHFEIDFPNLENIRQLTYVIKNPTFHIRIVVNLLRSFPVIENCIPENDFESI